MTTVLICGSRHYDDEATMRRVLSNELTLLDPNIEDDIRVIHGGATGADSLAAKVLARSIYSVHAFPADWKKHGKAAGPIRNRQMLDERPDLVLAFGDGRGTRDTVAEATRRGIEVVWIDGPVAAAFDETQP
jgi:hypothetical protein